MSTATVNPSFETAGVLQGIPLGWHRHASRNGRFIAGFASRAFDTFANESALDSGSWTPASTTVTANASNAPDGTATAESIKETAVNTTHSLNYASTVAFLAGHTYTFGAYLQSDGRNYAGLAVTTSGGVVATTSELAAGRISLYPVAAGQITKASAEVVIVDRWVQISLTFTVGTNLTAAPRLFLSRDGSAAAYLGDLHAGVYAWGAFLYEGDLRDVERFADGWLGSEDMSQTITDFDQALFDTNILDPVSHDVEDFEIGWLDNYPLQTEIAIATVALFDGSEPSGNVDVEAFDNGWLDNADGAVDTSISAGTQATFVGAITTEAFSSGWSLNEDIAFVPTVGTAARFDGTIAYAGSELFEDFEEGFEDVPFEVLSVGDDSLAATAHNLAATTPVFARCSTGGQLPGGLNSTLRYYVLSSGSPDSLKLSLTSGGAAVNITDTGTGSFWLRADPEHYWSGDDIGDA